MKLNMRVYLHTKFQVPGMFLTSFRHGGKFNLFSPQNEPLKSPPRLGLKFLNLSIKIDELTKIESIFLKNQLNDLIINKLKEII